MKKYKLKNFCKFFSYLIIFLTFINIISLKVFAADNTDILSVGRKIIKQYYIEDVADSTLNSAQDLNSMVKGLNDPYSAYFTQKQYGDFINSINNSFCGIGVQIDAAGEGIRVISVYDKSPALNAGIMTNDIITEVDGHSLKGLPLESASSYIKGLPGSYADIKLIREDRVLQYKVERKQIVLPTVESKVVDKHIGYIKISSFGENTKDEFNNNLLELKKSLPDSYIIDLRNNPGGYMDVAINIAGYFIGNNSALISKQKNGQMITYNSTIQENNIDKPVIFLINKNSASASEILSAAVKDYNKALFVGEKTFGKGVAQNIFTLPDNSYLKLTVFKFVSPLGNEINKVGISPDLEIKDDNKMGVDSLNAARILFSNLKSGEDKSGLAKVGIGGKTFEININEAKSKENFNTLKFMVNGIFNNKNFWLGDNKNWDSIDETKSVSEYIFPKTPETSRAEKGTEIKLVAANKTLPETGYFIDFNLCMEVGAALILAGLGIILKN